MTYAKLSAPKRLYTRLWCAIKTFWYPGKLNQS